MRKLIIAALVVAIGALAGPTLALASDHDYTISQDRALDNGRDAAQQRYERYGVTVLNSFAARPQYHVKDWDLHQIPQWHRWVVEWYGYDRDDNDVYGYIRIAAHSDGTFDAVPVFGGMKWYYAPGHLRK